MANKIKYNLKNVHYAVATINATTGKATYGDPVAIPGAVSISLEASGEPVIFYADGYAYYTVSNNQGYSGDLEIAMIPDGFRTAVLGETLDTNKMFIETGETNGAHFALLFEFDGDDKAIRHVLYNCTCTRPGMAGQTKEDTVEVKTETLTITAAPLASGYIKARTSDESDSTSYDAWYTTVYLPANETNAATNGL